MQFHHRDPGIVGLITRHTDNPQDFKDSKDSQNSKYSIKPINYGMIADGYHTSPSAIRMAYRANKQGLVNTLSLCDCVINFITGIVLVSDAAVVAGLPDGPYEIGDLPVEVKEGICVMRGTDTLAGRYLLSNVVKLFKII